MVSLDPDLQPESFRAQVSLLRMSTLNARYHGNSTHDHGQVVSHMAQEELGKERRVWVWNLM